MAINLKDIPEAVKAYLNTQVTVTITPFVPVGNSVQPNETFTFDVTVKNNGDVALKNVKYKVWAVNPGIAKVRTPTNGSSTDLEGNSIGGDQEVGGFIFNPSNNSVYDLPAGDHDALHLTGKAVSGPSGGTTGIRASVFADIDLDLLFPKGEDSGTSQRTLTVQG